MTLLANFVGSCGKLDDISASARLHLAKAPSDACNNCKRLFHGGFDPVLSFTTLEAVARACNLPSLSLSVSSFLVSDWISCGASLVVT